LCCLKGVPASMSKLVVDSEKCTGCRSCEIACSYHHSKTFNPNIASLHIHFVEKKGEITVILYKDLKQEEKKSRIPCDGCFNEPKPLCVKYCVSGAITVS